MKNVCTTLELCRLYSCSLGFVLALQHVNKLYFTNSDGPDKVSAAAGVL